MNSVLLLATDSMLWESQVEDSPCLYHACNVLYRSLMSLVNIVVCTTTSNSLSSEFSFIALVIMRFTGLWLHELSDISL